MSNQPRRIAPRAIACPAEGRRFPYTSFQRPDDCRHGLVPGVDAADRLGRSVTCLPARHPASHQPSLRDKRGRAIQQSGKVHVDKMGYGDQPSVIYHARTSAYPSFPPAWAKAKDR